LIAVNWMNDKISGLSYPVSW